MASILYRLVNTGLAGEPEHIALQSLDNSSIIEISNIDKVMEDGIREWDSDLDFNRMIQTPQKHFNVHTINGELILEI